MNLLESAARYRVVFADDLRGEADSDARFREDVRALERQGLLEHRTVTRLRDHTVTDVVAVTSAGKALLDDHRDPRHDRGQIYHAGWVKPREVWHDASLYRMCREATLDVERAGGQVRRIVLDDELKARAYRALHELRRRDGESPHQHDAVAAVQGLHVEDGRFVFPDVRLEIEDADGSVRSLDLELVTEHYHRGHLGGKARAGFRMYSSGAATTRGGTPRDEHAIERLLR